MGFYGACDGNVLLRKEHPVDSFRCEQVYPFATPPAVDSPVEVTVRSVGVHVDVAKVELIKVHWTFGVSAHIGELAAEHAELRQRGRQSAASYSYR